jgi:hypothetical protein
LREDDEYPHSSMLAFVRVAADSGIVPDSTDIVSAIGAGMHDQRRGEGRSPELSVVVCTLGEAALGDTVDSIAASARGAGSDVEIVVVWQGLKPPPQLGDDVHVLDVFPVGLSHARNRGLAVSRAPLVAFVDDDEVVDPGWVAGVLAAFAREQPPDAVFGPVAPLDDRGLPYCHYEGGEHRLFRDRSTPPWVVGTGGNMAYRRDVLEAAGGFDSRFGIGAPGKSAEESDLVVRLLGDGGILAFSPEMPVYHPTKNEDEHLASRYPYGFGMGSVMRRHRRPLLAARYFVTIGQGLGKSLRERDLRRRREVLATLRSFLAGMLSSVHPLSPAGALERLPGELLEALGGAAPEPLGASLGDRPHFRYAAGDDRLLHVYVSPAPELVESIASADGSAVSRVVAHAHERDALWVVERVGRS